MNNNIPLYQIEINENEGAFVDAIALVKTPAIESEFIAFSKENEDLKFSTDEEKMELIGAALIPDIKIFRINPETKEQYNVTFSKETIRKIAQIYMKRGLQNAINIEHHSDISAKSFIFQSYIVDSEKGLNSPKDLNLPDGTWIIGVKVLDKNIWEGIKSGKVAGFSVEGFFKMIEKQKNSKVKSEEEEILELIEEINSILTTTMLNK